MRRAKLPDRFREIVSADAWLAATEAFGWEQREHWELLASALVAAAPFIRDHDQQKYPGWGRQR